MEKERHQRLCQNPSTPRSPTTRRPPTALGRLVPVETSGPLTIGSIPAADLDRLISATLPDDLSPVELDPPAELAPVARWQKLAEEADDELAVYHCGNAELVMPMPRPAWSAPALDLIGACIDHCAYRSMTTEIAASRAGGQNDGTYWERDSVGVAAMLWGDGTASVNLRIRRRIGNEWKRYAIIITRDEAIKLAEVLRAAVDLTGR